MQSVHEATDVQRRDRLTDRARRLKNLSAEIEADTGQVPADTYPPALNCLVRLAWHEAIAQLDRAGQDQ